MLRKKRFTNFTKTTVEAVSVPAHSQPEATETAQFSVTTKTAELKSLLKKLQRQLEAFSPDSDAERFSTLKAAISALEKHLKKPMVVEFLAFTFLKEIQTLQKGVSSLVHRMYITRKLSEIIKRVPPGKAESVIKILLNLVLAEKDTKIKASLITCLVKIYKGASEAGQEIVLKEDVLKDFLAVYPTLGFHEDVDKKALKLIMHMIIKDKTKLEAFSNLLFIEAKKSPNLIGYFIKLVKKVNVDNYPGELVHLWAEILIELVPSSRELEDVQVEILEFFSEIFNKEEMKDLREAIFNYYCECVRNFDRKIKKKATEVIGKATNVSEQTLLVTLKKEELSNYKNKKKTKKDEITTSDVSFTAENSKALALNRVTGTFIYLLEDEFHEVRLEAINSIRDLAERFPEFAREVRDILFYMLHDESDLVRIGALEALSKVLKEISLGEFEKDLLLFNIKEDVYCLRVGIYKLMKIIRSKNEDILHQLINGLLVNLETYVEDKMYIFEALRAMVANNKGVIEKYMSNLLAQEERFLVQEPDWKSSRHIGKMILLATAASVLPHLAKQFPYYYEKHFSYLADIYPDYFRVDEALKATETKSESTSTQQLQSLVLVSLPQNNFRVENIVFQEILSCFSKKVSTEQAVKILKNLEDSLTSVLKSTNTSKNFLRKILTVAQQHFRILADIQDAYSLQAVFAKWKDNVLYDIFVQMISISESYEIKDPKFRKLLNRLQFFFLLFCLSKIVNSGLMTKTIYQKKILEIGLFLFNNFSDKSLHEELPGSNEVLQAIENMVRNPGAIQRTDFLTSLNKKLISFMKSAQLECEGCELDIIDLKRISAEILEPSTNTEDSIEFHAQLFVKLTIIADIHNAKGVNGICVGIKSQDEKVNMFKITPNDIMLEEGPSNTLKIRSNLHIDYGHWNRPAMIEIFLVKLLDPENGQLINLLDNHAFMSEVMSQMNGRFFVISNSVKLMIRPVY